jgi:hypothetical protein
VLEATSQYQRDKSGEANRSYPFGILNLVAHDRSLPISEYVSQSFSKKTLSFGGNKFDACDEMIAGSPDK